jgi:gentisate 1,2-dioxygenase
MSWHDHTSSVDGEMFWFDGLDLPMVAALDGVFFEEYPGPGESQPEPVEHNVSERTHAAGRRYVAGSVGEVLSPRHSPLMNYRWADTAAELDRLAAAGDEPLISVEYVDPETGASVLPTMACAVHRIRAGRRSAPVRRAGNAIYVAYQGSGSSVIGGQRFDWGPGDMFVVPSWVPVEHAAQEQADLFVVSDEPVFRALGIARSQTLTEPQQVTGTFTPR